LASERFEPAALIKSILVHLFVISLFFVSWKRAEILETPKAMPQHIMAVVMEKPQPKSQPKPRQEVKKPKPKKPEPKKPAPKKVEPKKKPEPTKPVATRPVPTKKPEPKPEKKATKKPESKPAQTDDSSDFSDLLKSEMKELDKQPKTAPVTAPAASTTDTSKEQDEIQQYVGLIQQTISRYWIRPPSARTGMIVTLSLNLLPGGELNEVNVVESSGNAAFDRPAVLAVQKAGRFPVPDDPILFDRYFRTLKVRFNPEDLRY